jgi:GntR family transcriptional regulator
MKIILSNKKKTPIYEQIKIQLKDQVLEGAILAESKLPSIRLLAKNLGISVITVKRAYDDLESEGYTYTIGGKGTFITDQKIEKLKEEKIKDIENTLKFSFNEMKKLGVEKTYLSRLLSETWKEEK